MPKSEAFDDAIVFDAFCCCGFVSVARFFRRSKKDRESVVLLGVVFFQLSEARGGCITRTRREQKSNSFSRIHSLPKMRDEKIQISPLLRVRRRRNLFEYYAREKEREITKRDEATSNGKDDSVLVFFRDVFTEERIQRHLREKDDDARPTTPTIKQRVVVVVVVVVVVE